MDNYNKDENSKKLDFEKLSEEFDSLIEEGRYGRLLSRVHGSVFKALWNCQWSLAFRLLIFAGNLLRLFAFVSMMPILLLLTLWLLIFYEPSDFNKANEAYENGDYKTAVEYYMKAAENDSVNRAVAFNRLGVCYDDGKGVEQNYSVAVKYYRQSADLGYHWGECNLGYCYYVGRGVAKDYKEALKWYKLAAKNGSAEAYNNIGQCYLNGHGVKQDYAKAVIFFKKAVSKGSHLGEYNLGYCYYFGMGVKPDMTKAKEYIKSAADKGNSQAKEMLKIMQDEK